MAQRDQGDPASARTRGRRDAGGGALILREDGEPDVRALRTDIEAARHQIAETFDTIQDQLEEQTGWKALAAARNKALRAQYQGTETLKELKAYTRSPADATAWIRDHPIQSLTLAFGVGIIIGLRPFR